jgi:hypothetical protein
MGDDPQFGISRKGQSCGAIAMVAIALTLPTSATAFERCPGKAIVRPAANATPLPVPASRAPCTQGYRLQASPTLAFWRCDDGGNGAMSSAAILVEQNGRVRDTFSDAVSAGALSSWHLIGADLDGSGRNTWIVATWNAQSQGLGINSWTLHMFTPYGRLITKTSGIGDWSPDLVVKAANNTAGCAVGLARYVGNSQGQTSWRVQFHRTTRTRLVREQGRTTYVRRLTTTFQQERAAWFSQPGFVTEGDPKTWLMQARPLRD